MNAYDFVHLALSAIGGRIEGKTKLQKTVYFLGVMSGCLEDLGYRAHYYGPYSADVAEAMDRLVSLGFVNQSVAGAGALDSRGFEVARYDFDLNEEGERVAKSKAERYPEEWQKIEEAAARLKSVGDQDYMKLSVAAKTHFTLGQKKGPATLREISDLASGFGWSVPLAEVKAGALLLQSLRLVDLQGSS